MGACVNIVFVFCNNKRLCDVVWQVVLHPWADNQEMRIGLHCQKHL